jgi:hypothetical protein
MNSILHTSGRTCILTIASEVTKETNFSNSASSSTWVLVSSMLAGVLLQPELSKSIVHGIGANESECSNQPQNIEVGAVNMKKCPGGRDSGKEVGWVETHNCGSGRHFSPPGDRNASRRDYVKGPHRSVTAEANRVRRRCPPGISYLREKDDHWTNHYPVALQGSLRCWMRLHKIGARPEERTPQLVRQIANWQRIITNAKTRYPYLITSSTIFANVH